MGRKWLAVLLVCVPIFGWAQTQTGSNRALPVSALIIEGAQRVPESTYRYYIQTKVGDLFDPEMIRQDVDRLWNSGLLEGLRVETEETSQGMRVVFHITEKPLIEEVVWPEKIRHYKLEEMVQRLRDKGAALDAGEPLDSYRIYQAQKIIKEMYAEKGYRFAVVKAEVVPLDSSRVKVVWTVDPGDDVRVGEIVFEGNQAFPDKKLRGQFKKVKQTGLWSHIWGKDKYDPAKLEEDLQRLREFYHNKGFIDVRVGEPRVEIYTDGKGGKGKPRLRIVIPVQEGDRYRIGDIRFEGNKVFSAEELSRFLVIHPGDWFSRKKVEKCLQAMIDAYGERGYIGANIVPDTFPRADAETPTADLVFRVQENKPQYLRRIEFVGNTFTFDTVIRRELEIQEAQLINVKLLRRSLKKLFRLGYFDNVEPELRPVEGEDDKVDLILKVSENLRNQIQAGGGYSELEGIFGTLGFATRNLFGTGKSVSLNLQIGRRIQTYQISIADPYFLNRDIYLGLDLYNTWSNLFIFERRNKGGGLSLGWPLWRDLDFRIGYAYTQVRIDNVNQDLARQGFGGLFVGSVTELSRTDSRISPQLIYNSLNDPIDPSDGGMYILRLDYAGGPLGGNVDIIRPSFRITRFIPVNRHGHRFAINVEGGFIKSHGKFGVPFYERYYLGGDFSIRGYDFRTVGPIDPKISTRYTVGGTKYGQFNLEYIIPIAQSPASLVFFWDGGNTFAENEAFDFSKFRFSTGIEFRIVIPAIMTPMRIIFARNWNRGPLVEAKPWAIRFGIGRTF